MNQAMKKKIAEIRETWDGMKTICMEETEAVEFDKVMRGEQT